MGKVLKGVAIAAAFVALAYATGGLSVVAAGTAGAATVAGVTFTTTFLGSMLVSMAAASILTGISQQFLGAKLPKTQLSRLNVSLDPSTPRKAVFGTTAMPLDLRYHESSGADQDYVDYIVAVAAHKVGSIDEIWFEEKLAWTAAGGVTGTYAGYLTVTTRTEGSAANYISINGGTKWGSSRRLTGCAYVHLRIKRTGNTKKAESPLVGGLPSRVTVIGDGARLYDPRKDSTVVGGSGSHRATDQTTWGAYTAADDTDNPALQLLWWMLGWKINGKLSVGCGIPYNRIDMASFITAANICDENVTLAIGGTQKRYRSSGTASDGDDRSEIINNLLISMNATLRDNGGKLTLVAMKNDLANYVLTFSESDMLAGFDWQQTRGLTENYNLIRGRYVDPSPNSLYQMVDYPEIGLVSSDGIERVMSVDLAYVEDGRRAQRLAKQILQRNQYRGMFSTTFNAKALGCQVGDVVRINLETLGWVNKPFRVVSQEIRFDGQVPMALIEENAAIYAWDAEDVTPITPTAPTIYNPLNNPFILGLAEAEAVADGKIDSYYQASEPTGATEGDYWTDTDDSNKMYRYTSGAWVLIRDTGIPAAISAAAGAQATADGKVTTFYVETTPTAIAVGDLWYKPSTKYLTRWNGSAWADVATVGAKAGTNLFDSAGATLGDAAIITSQGTAALIANQGPGATAAANDVLNNRVENGVVYIGSPVGGSYSYTGGLITGAIKIVLPTYRSSTMMRFFLDIYDYNQGIQTATYEIGGYNYGDGSWYNVFATKSGPRGGSLPVRFGHDGVNDIIWIGDGAENWYYPNVRVRNFQGSQNNITVAVWDDAWGVSITNTARTNVTNSVLVPRAGDAVFGEGVLEAGTGGVIATLPNFKTAQGTAAAIAGQGSLATSNTADWASQIASRPVELTDGRITNGFNNLGRLRSGIQLDASSAFTPAIEVLGALKGTNLNKNPEFFGNSLAGYSVYNNNGDGSVNLSSRYDTTVPNGSGYAMEVNYTGGNPTPGYGGFTISLAGTTGQSRPGYYTQNATIYYYFWAVIPVGRRLEFHTNAYGNGGTWEWVSDTAGTGGWQKYIGKQVTGIGGSLSITGYFAVHDGPNTAFTWVVGKLDIMDVSSVPKSFLGNGNLYEQDGGYRLTNANSITSFGTAAAIAGQGALATRNDVTDSQLGSTLAARVAPFSGDQNYLSAGRVAWDVTGSTVQSLKPAEAGANVTETRTAAAIAGQGPGATAAADFVLNNREEGGQLVHVPYPVGGYFANNNANVTGIIKITLPQAGISTMLKFTVDIFDYTTGHSVTYVIAGYPYNGMPATWVNCSAQILGPRERSHEVRFGHDGSKVCVWIGDTTTTWQYPQIRVRDFMGGYANFNVTNWQSGWSISITGNAATNVTSTVVTPRAGDAVYGEGILEAGTGGVVATLANFKTAQGTAAAIASQGYFATRNYVFGGGPGTLGDGRLINEDNTRYITDAGYYTPVGTAAAIAGQAATATNSDFSAVTGTTKPANNANNTYVDGNGAVQGVSSGGGTVVDNTKVLVGARNLMTNSGQFTAIPNWSSNGATVSLDATVLYGSYSTLKIVGFGGAQKDTIMRLKPNTQYTVSAMVKGSAALAGAADNTLHIQSWRDEDTGNIHQETIIAVDTAVTTSWKLIYQTFVTPNSATLTYCRFYFYPLAAGFTLNVGYVKLEEGNKATDWIQAPEELTSGINSAALTADWPSVSGTGKPENNADVTITAQVTPTKPDDVIINADYLGAILAGQFNKYLVPGLTRAGSSVRLDNRASYSVSNITGGLTGYVSVDSTNGSGNKGVVTVTNCTASGTFQLNISWDGYLLAAYVIRFTVIAADAPLGGGGAGGTKSGSVDITGQTVSSTSFVSIAQIDNLTKAAGETIKCSLPAAEYELYHTADSTRNVIAKFQYSATGANSWTDVGTQVSGSSSTWDQVDLSTSPGSITVNQNVAPSNGAYDIRLVVARNASGGGNLNFSYGTMAVIIEV